MKNHQVRFHLARGEHYMHWQVKTFCRRNGKVATTYFDPRKHQLELTNCSLYNNSRVAQKVKDKGVKDVCGWINCEDYSIRSMPVDYLERIYYNPIKDIHWRRESDDGEFEWDNTSYSSLLTYGNQVYILEERD